MSGAPVHPKPADNGAAKAPERADILRELAELETALGTARHANSAEVLRSAHRTAHRVYVQAEQAGFAEVANAIFHIEDALRAMTEGQIAADTPSWRQVDAACRAARSALEVPASGHHAVVPGPKASILVIEHEAELAGDFFRATSKKRFSVCMARDAEEARKAVREQSFQVLVVDWDGQPPEARASLVTELRSAEGSRDAQLVIMCGDQGFATRLSAAQACAAVFLAKPVSGEKLASLLDGLDLRTTREKPRVVILTEHGNRTAELRQTLETAAIEVSLLREPETTLETLEAVQPAAFFIDGYANLSSDLCRVLRATSRWRDLPILVRPPSGDAEAASAILEAGADDCLDLQLTDRELLARLNCRLERTRMFREHSNRDLLTGLLTRRAFTEAIQARLAEAARARRHLSLCLLDIDHLEQVNETYGHATGDQVLAAFGNLLGTRFRLPDLRGRWGGEEFVVAFYGEWAESAREILVRVTGEFARMDFDGGSGRVFQVSVSGGIATYPLNGVSLDDLVLVADQRLYAAKHAGRNRIRI